MHAGGTRLQYLLQSRDEQMVGCSAPGRSEGTVSTVKMLGSGWSNATELTGLNLARSYLQTFECVLAACGRIRICDTDTQR